MPAPDRAELQLELFHHICLPRDVPGHQSDSMERVDAELLHRLIQAVKAIAPFLPLEHHGSVDAVRIALTTAKLLNVEAEMDRKILLKEFRELDARNSLILFIAEQNAAILIYRESKVSSGDDDIIFEAFEASAVSDQVLASQGALLWDFPGSAAKVPYSTFSNTSFQDCLSAFLQQATMESVKAFCAITQKAASPLPEIRDTTNPALISGLLMTLLGTVGKVHHPIILQKRVRDTVRFLHARKPWRRSSLYLVIRVSMLRHLYRFLGPEVGRLYYKVIMCLFLSHFLDDSRQRLPPDAVHLLRQKLSRRLAKIESRKDPLIGTAGKLTVMWGRLSTVFERSLNTAAQSLESQWEGYKARAARPIRRLPQFAHPDDLKLQLRLSGSTLSSALFRTHVTNTARFQSPAEHLYRWESANKQTPALTALSARYSALLKYEEDIVLTAKCATKSNDNHTRCIHLADTIRAYTSKVADAYNVFPLLKSRMLLNVLELWVEMDKAAMACYGLLKEHGPGLNADMLDALHLMSNEDMGRLRKVQLHIISRVSEDSETIFASPTENCFAVRYFNGSQEMIRLHDQIKSDAAKSREEKKKEWEETSSRHDKLTKQIAEMACQYTETVNEFGETIMEHRGCLKHKLKWQARQMKIRIWEHPLPASEAFAKAAVFELCCPKAFAAYRDATWYLLKTFARHGIEPVPQRSVIRDYPGLRKYVKRNVVSDVTLGSSTKSHLETHYGEVGFPVAWKHVCLPFGMKLSYYDTSCSFWTSDLRPSLEHQFPLNLPPTTPYRSFLGLYGPWPSSNQILASQTKCPAESLLVGTHCRWLSLLRELGSTNINFSTESTWAVVTRLILQAGPASTEDLLRDVHAVFRDSEFCGRLLEQVRRRLEAIRRSWRESLQMSLAISILIRMIELAPTTEIKQGAIKLLKRARDITWGWQQILKSAGVHNATGLMPCMVWASLLCKRVFYTLFEKSKALDSSSLGLLISSSIHLQNIFTQDWATLPFPLQKTVLEDLISTYLLRTELRTAICANNAAFVEALSRLWPIPSNAALAAVDELGEEWIGMTLQRDNQCTDALNYHLLTGILLINGCQLGSLPLEYRRWPIVQQLFGSSNLNCLPSRLDGMSFTLDSRMPNGHWIHFDLRGDGLIIQAVKGDRRLQLIPSGSFQSASGQDFDLPFHMVSNCYHWLDLRSGIMEIRQGDPWKSRQSHWYLDFHGRRAQRTVKGRCLTLIDPYSNLFSTIASNFRHFEFARHILAYQPDKSHMRVELKRLELDFFVAKSGFLKNDKLKCVILKDQDPGTWYGLHSKLVVASTENTTERSILVPMGEYKFLKDEFHIKMFVTNRGDYLRFNINPVLGRVECPVEPRMLYLKALFHACTSSFLPDPLTPRTGVEESLTLLRSGLYQPWDVVNPQVAQILYDIAGLSPKRNYYPSHLRCMETVKWSECLTTHIQDDRYHGAIEKILRMLSDLALFSLSPVQYTPPAWSKEQEHLETRALSHLYTHNFKALDTCYPSRDRYIDSTERKNIQDIVQLLSKWQACFQNTTELAHLLEDSQLICGYIRNCDLNQITDFLTVDMKCEWGALARTCLNSGFEDRFQLMFMFSKIGFTADADMNLVRALIACAISKDLKSVEYPTCPSFVAFRNYQSPTTDLLTQLIKGACVPFDPVKANAPRGQLAIQRFAHEKESLRLCMELARSILSQWPQTTIDVSRLIEVDADYLEKDRALELVRPEWERLTHNWEFSEYLQKLQIILDHGSNQDMNAQPGDCESEQYPGMGSSSHINPAPRYPAGSDRWELPTIPALLEQDMLVFSLSGETVRITPAAPILTIQTRTHTCGDLVVLKTLQVKVLDRIKELSQLVSELEHSSSAVQRKYGKELQQSVEALSEHLSLPKEPLLHHNPVEFGLQLAEAKEFLEDVLSKFCTVLEQNERSAKWLRLTGLWPSMTLISLLTELRSSSGLVLGRQVKENLVRIGLAVTTYQRLLRMQNSLLKRKGQQFHDERQNPGHRNWDPLDHVDWLLLEIDANILLRPEQVEVAQATISPPSRHNSVLQLLMGRGKTSCILPMAASTLANRKQLARIVVPRALLLQSAQVIQAKIGGLLNRELTHVTFSRRTQISSEVLETFCRLHNHCMDDQGVMIALPEHILSFQLCGRQRICDGRFKEAERLIAIQLWLERNARDILDECDFSLAVRTQLIYPSGSQMAVDGHPYRWQAIETILRLIPEYLPRLEEEHPHSIEIDRGLRGAYPLMYFLRTDGEEFIILKLVNAICSGQTSIMPCADYPLEVRSTIQTFILSPTVSKEEVKGVKAIFKDNSHLMKIAYLLRGLFVHRILISSLKKRWNVTYGLHPTRDPIAVPYSAKGEPSPTNEWGHPDVAIILTCLSFYYEGLDISRFKQAFQHLLKSDEPGVEYEKWATHDLPGSFRDYHAINVEDSVQLSELHRFVRYNPYLLDYYLNNFVFPAHAKQFASKLQASGWDLILFNPKRRSHCQTTGFSGTNDTRHQLPMTIKQNDLQSLSHTNAEVLYYLLQPRNRHYVRMIDGRGRRLSEEGFLKKLLRTEGGESWERSRPIRILIDAGAQILEHDNRGLANLWLQIDDQALAAVFFDSNHRANVIWGKGKEMPLSVSPFAENLEGCLVYLDQSHCRGTDLKLPADARAALTLGPQLSKDALVQAAMRLRLLGDNQSVTFFAPPEVHQSILDLRGYENPAQQLESSDVIAWLLQQTCNGIEQTEPLYYNQGMDYLKRLKSKPNNSSFVHDPLQRTAYLKVIRSTERQTLEELYGPKFHRAIGVQPYAFAPPLKDYVVELLQRRKEFQDRGFAVHSSALEEVEQEREIEQELEMVRETQKPTFAMTGRLPAPSSIRAYDEMYSVLKRTSIGRKHAGVLTTSLASNIHVSRQFERTVKLSEPNDNFLRPCQWILWSRLTATALIVSPEEADLLIPILRTKKKPLCHLIVYAAPVTRRMLHFNNLDYYAVPPLPASFEAPMWLKIHVGIFAGRLYFDWEEYSALLELFGASSTSDEPISQRNALVSRPSAFLHDWLAVRRKGQDFEHTPMGSITTGKPLTVDHPFFLPESVEEDGEPGNEGALGTFLHADENVDEDDEDDQGEEFHDAEEGDDGDGADHEYGAVDHEEPGRDFFESDEYFEAAPVKESSKK
ncbi:uncharacterized protein EI97DRAFT_450390 [Westerdykella ornata]|uniref:ubiquitinyl hydrolase 1 n=1 Tax=Westerdykella ornata TaxID=318751 RepID=A0A6A6JJF1_WESOR|nr:uncharacterized protein EI97DRAFT_450390 [Westerdykella ornata]KAF2276617.1 hypothetical protein EI97DRAFT_450390 [Westerdykella ornata]